MKPRPLNQETLNEVLDERIRPFLSLDGAVVTVVKLEDATGSVQVRLDGRYFGCPGRQTVLDKLLRPVLEQELEGLTSMRLVD
ncbi:MAG: NifU family protein [Myxococcota bacterium]|jgi:Fe-S cluster biogenesis protein NfuA|nr:NifU family protein [Myxococcota bacterium]